MRILAASALKKVRIIGARFLAALGLQPVARRHLSGLRRWMEVKERQLRNGDSHRHDGTVSGQAIQELRGAAITETVPPTLLLLNDCRDQDNHGAQVLVDALLDILATAIPAYRLRTIPSHWVIDATHGFGAFVNSGASLRQPQALWPEVADEFETVADEWLNDRAGVGARAFMERLTGSDIVILNGEGSIYRRNASAIRELFLAWFAKTRLGIPTVFLNGMVHLTDVVPILPAMVRKTFSALDAVAVREPRSLRNLREYAPDVDVRMIPDSAFYLAREIAADGPPPNPLQDRLGGEEYFTFDPGAMPVGHRFGRRSALFRLISELKQIVPRAVLISSAPADLYIEAVARETDSLFVRGLPGYRDLMGVLSGATFMVTGRHHNPILGAIVGCPSITFASSSHKVHGMCELLEGQIGFPHDGTDLTSSMPAIAAQARRYVEDRARIGEALKGAAERLGTAVLEMGEVARAALREPVGERRAASAAPP